VEFYVERQAELVLDEDTPKGVVALFADLPVFEVYLHDEREKAGRSETPISDEPLICAELAGNESFLNYVFRDLGRWRRVTRT
jgi:hypothetical protein